MRDICNNYFMYLSISDDIEDLTIIHPGSISIICNVICYVSGNVSGNVICYVSCNVPGNVICYVTSFFALLGKRNVGERYVRDV